jgi:3-oxoacyl-(acyl-carrier-protein) synthase
VETVLTLQALAAQRLPAQANCSQPDPQLQFRLPQQNEQLGAARGGGGHIALANSFGFGGRNISLVLQAAPLNGHQG